MLMTTYGQWLPMQVYRSNLPKENNAEVIFEFCRESEKLPFDNLYFHWVKKKTVPIKFSKVFTMTPQVLQDLTTHPTSTSPITSRTSAPAMLPPSYLAPAPGVPLQHSCLGAFRLAVLSAWTTLLLAVCMACSLLCFKFMLRCYVFSETFSDHFIQNCNADYHPYSLCLSPTSFLQCLCLFNILLTKFTYLFCLSPQLHCELHEGKDFH